MLKVLKEPFDDMYLDYVTSLTKRNNTFVHSVCSDTRSLFGDAAKDRGWIYDPDEFQEIMIKVQDFMQRLEIHTLQYTESMNALNENLPTLSRCSTAIMDTGEGISTKKEYAPDLEQRSANRLTPIHLYRDGNHITNSNTTLKFVTPFKNTIEPISAAHLEAFSLKIEEMQLKIVQMEKKRCERVPDNLLEQVEALQSKVDGLTATRNSNPESEHLELILEAR